jgi:hypothetical protein
MLAFAMWPASLAYDSHVRARAATARRGFMRIVGASFLAVPAATSAVTSVPPDYDAFAGGYDNLDGGPLASALGLEGLRAGLIERARGRTLEVLPNTMAS